MHDFSTVILWDIGVPNHSVKKQVTIHSSTNSVSFLDAIGFEIPFKMNLKIAQLCIFLCFIQLNSILANSVTH